MKRYAIILFIVLLFSSAFIGCNEKQHNSLSGYWYSSDNGQTVYYRIKEDSLYRVEIESMGEPVGYGFRFETFKIKSANHNKYTVTKGDSVYGEINFEDSTAIFIEQFHARGYYSPLKHYEPVQTYINIDSLTYWLTNNVFILELAGEDFSECFFIDSLYAANKQYDNEARPCVEEWYLRELWGETHLFFNWAEYMQGASYIIRSINEDTLKTKLIMTDSRIVDANYKKKDTLINHNLPGLYFVIINSKPVWEGDEQFTLRLNADNTYESNYKLYENSGKWKLSADGTVIFLRSKTDKFVSLMIDSWKNDSLECVSGCKDPFQLSAQTLIKQKEN